jgi:hypothetical protein
MREWRHVEEILTLYESALGQKINRENTSIFFSKNTSLEARGDILSAAGAFRLYLDGLGSLPLTISKAEFGLSLMDGRINSLRMLGRKSC